MNLLNDKKTRELFSETFKYRGLIKDLSKYEIEKIIDMVNLDLSKEVDQIAGMVNIPIDSYNYPSDIDETKLFEYWSDRVNAGKYHELQVFKAQLTAEIDTRKQDTQEQTVVSHEEADNEPINNSDTSPEKREILSLSKKYCKIPRQKYSIEQVQHVIRYASKYKSYKKSILIEMIQDDPFCPDGMEVKESNDKHYKRHDRIINFYDENSGNARSKNTHTR